MAKFVQMKLFSSYNRHLDISSFTLLNSVEMKHAVIATIDHMEVAL